jgi:hypothetical protein
MIGVNGANGVTIAIYFGRQKNKKKALLKLFQFQAPLTPPLYPIGALVYSSTVNNHGVSFSRVIS